MAPDFDTLRRMWRCYCLRIASVYNFEYKPPTDMPDLWENMRKTHSLFTYSGKPHFPTTDTPEDAHQYIEQCARALLLYKDKMKQQMIASPSVSTFWFWWLGLLSLSLMLVFAGVPWHANNKTCVVALFLLSIIMTPFICKKKEIKKPSKVLLVYKDPPDNDVSYIDKHLPPRCKYTIKLDTCDFILSTKFVWGHSGLEPHQNFLTEYGKQPKKVLVFWITDSNDVFDVPHNVYFFRTSLYRRWRNPTEDVLPFVFDPFARQDFRPLVHNDKPIIGFCGASWTNRKHTLDQFRNDDRFQTIYVEHDHFSAGTRDMYMKNILDSHFTICDRGAGNFTMRFWHVLSLGRVPILVEDDMVWPFAKEIDWDKICVRAQNSIELAEKTLTFYKTYSHEKVQQRCLEIYQRYFTTRHYLDRVISATISD